MSMMFGRPGSDGTRAFSLSSHRRGSGTGADGSGIAAGRGEVRGRQLDGAASGCDRGQLGQEMPPGVFGRGSGKLQDERKGLGRHAASMLSSPAEGKEQFAFSRPRNCSARAARKSPQATMNGAAPPAADERWGSAPSAAPATPTRARFMRAASSASSPTDICEHAPPPARRRPSSSTSGFPPGHCPSPRPPSRPSLGSGEVQSEPRDSCPPTTGTGVLCPQRREHPARAPPARVSPRFFGPATPASTRSAPRNPGLFLGPGAYCPETKPPGTGSK